ncbi:MAG TPA: ABC transporter ATP-binding protein [Pyrinomonadaceae bacterium]|nr:ABC transporter ATP-binding protein [Pyrinomonadaceae bacterium]
MPVIDFVVQTQIDRTIRVKQLEAMFDVPASERARIEFKGDCPIESFDWNVGLIVGPSGCGKSSILSRIFAAPEQLQWSAKSVIDDFDPSHSMQNISEICQSVGFNTIPAWMRPFSVLSNGEKFRVELARRLLTREPLIVMDEFTSVVDRQVAQIGAHAVQKYVRKHGKPRFVAASCHYDILDWLQPDWILEPATMHFARRSLQPRPPIDIEIRRVKYDYWKLFSPFHYLTAELNHAASCYCLFANGRAASFCAVLHRPHPRAKNVKGISRLVTLPDWQGLGLALILATKLGAAYRSAGFRFRMYPAHPALIRSFAQRRELWSLEKRGGTYSHRVGTTSTIPNSPEMGGFGGRPCAVFEYVGAPMDLATAQRLLAA